VFAREDKFKTPTAALRTHQQSAYALKSLAYTMINLRQFLPTVIRHCRFFQQGVMRQDGARPFRLKLTSTPQKITPFPLVYPLA